MSSERPFFEGDYGASPFSSNIRRGCNTQSPASYFMVSTFSFSQLGACFTSCMTCWSKTFGFKKWTVSLKTDYENFRLTNCTRWCSWRSMFWVTNYQTVVRPTCFDQCPVIKPLRPVAPWQVLEFEHLLLMLCYKVQLICQMILLKTNNIQESTSSERTVLLTVQGSCSTISCLHPPSHTPSSFETDEDQRDQSLADTRPPLKRRWCPHPWFQSACSSCRSPGHLPICAAKT